MSKELNRKSKAEVILSQLSGKKKTLKGWRVYMRARRQYRMKNRTYNTSCATQKTSLYSSIRGFISRYWYSLSGMSLPALYMSYLVIMESEAMFDLYNDLLSTAYDVYRHSMKHYYKLLITHR